MHTINRSLFVWILLPFITTAKNSDWSSQLQQAVQAFRGYDYIKVIEILEPLSRKDPSHTQFILGLANSHYRLAKILEHSQLVFDVLNHAYLQLLKAQLSQMERSVQFQYYQALQRARDGDLSRAAREFAWIAHRSPRLRERARLWRQACLNNAKSDAQERPAETSTEGEGLPAKLFFGSGAFVKSANTPFPGQAESVLTKAAQAWVQLDSGHTPEAYQLWHQAMRTMSADDSLKLDSYRIVHFYHPYALATLARLNARLALMYFRQLNDPDLRRRQQVDVHEAEMDLLLGKMEHVQDLLNLATQSLSKQLLLSEVLFRTGKKNQAWLIWNHIQKNGSALEKVKLGLLQQRLNQSMAKVSEQEIQQMLRNADQSNLKEIGWWLFLKGNSQLAYKVFNQGFAYEKASISHMLDPEDVLKFTLIRFTLGKKYYSDILGQLYELKRRLPFIHRLYDLMQSLASPRDLNIGRSPTQ